MAYRYKTATEEAAEKATKVETFEKVKAAVALTNGQWEINDRLFSFGFNLVLPSLASFDCRIFKNVVRVYASKYTQVSHLSTNFKRDASPEEIAAELKAFGDTVTADRADAKAKATAKEDAVTNAVNRLQKTNPNVTKESNGFRLADGRSYRKASGTFNYNQTEVKDVTLYNLTFEQVEKILAIVAE
jgi:hypothetical protein